MKLMLAVSLLLAGASPASIEIDALDWLVGDWVAYKGELSAEESWSAPYDDMMIGTRWSDDTGRQRSEEMRIVRAPDGLRLTLRRKEETETSFPLIDAGKEFATFSNFVQGRPITIRYWREGKLLHIRIFTNSTTLNEWIYHRK